MKEAPRRCLRLGIDVRDLSYAQSGQKTYLEELLRALRLLEGTDLKVVVFNTSLPVYVGHNRWLKLLEHAKLHWYKQVVLPLKVRLKGCDVLFTSDYFVPYFSPGFRTITVFHDAFFFETPEHYSPLFLKFFHRVAVPSAKRCARIVVPSEYVRRKLAGLLDVDPGFLVTIYEAPKSFNVNQSVADTGRQALAQWQLATEPYILHVGMLNKRKNIPFLIRAFSQVLHAHPGLKLVLAGSMDALTHINDRQEIERALRETGVGQKVVLTGYVNNTQLEALYRHATLYVFPSLNEGFGLPVLEAFTYGVPVLVASNSCLPEIGGQAVVPFDPEDENNLAAEINRLLSNPEARMQLRQAGFARLKLFSWQRAAEQLVALCRQI